MLRKTARSVVRSVGRGLRLLLAALLAPVAVIVMAFVSARGDRRARRDAAEPGTLTEVSFSEARIVGISQSPKGALRIALQGPFRMMRMSPSGVAEEQSEDFEADVPFVPELMAALATIQQSSLTVDGELRFVSRSDPRTRSSEVLQMLRIAPSGRPEAGLEMTLE